MVPAYRVRVLLAIPLPHRPVPRVIIVDDFAVRRRNRYATARHRILLA
ncbi:hypothetical protein IU427_23455 [Nocardia beijingensis]|nr:hypothetical protein [Nocardia beijingensis]